MFLKDPDYKMFQKRMIQMTIDCVILRVIKITMPQLGMILETMFLSMMLHITMFFY